MKTLVAGSPGTGVVVAGGGVYVDGALKVSLGGKGRGQGIGEDRKGFGGDQKGGTLDNWQLVMEFRS